MASLYKKPSQVAEINVVPYIDVMLVLLVIFVITAPLLLEGVKLELPETTAGQIRKEDQRLVVAVTAEEVVYIENSDQNIEMNVSELEDYARIIVRRKPDIQVLVRGDKTSSYGAVIEVMAALQRAGVIALGLITETEEDGV